MARSRLDQITDLVRGHGEDVSGIALAESGDLPGELLAKRDGSKRQSPYPACHVSSIISRFLLRRS